MSTHSWFHASVGLNLNTAGLKGAALSIRNGKSVIDNLFFIPQDPLKAREGHVKPLYMQGQEEILADLVSKRLPATTLKTSKTFSRSLKLSLKKEKDIQSVLKFEAEPLLPFPLEEAIIDKTTFQKDSEGTEIIVFAAKKEEILHHIEEFNEIHIDPEVVSSTPFALATFAKNYVEEKAILLLHLGWDETSLVLIQEGMPLAAFSTTGLYKVLGSPDAPLEELDTEKPLDSRFDSFFQEVKKVIFALKKQHEDEEIPLLISGDGVRIFGLVDRILKENKISEAKLKDNPLDKEQLLSYALVIGLAETALTTSNEQVNFRAEELSFPHPFKRLFRPLATLFSAALLFALALFIFSSVSIDEKKVIAKNKFAELLSDLGMSWSDFEAEWKKGRPQSRNIPLSELSQAELLERLNFLKKRVEETELVFPLKPNAPTVTDTLAWLSNNPLIKGTKEKPGDITLESFSYKMTKRPTAQKPQEPYQVKVDLDFSTPSTRAAREFHEALLAPNDFVDPTNEIQWSAEREKYRTSFFLKDKTAYPRG